MVGGPALNQLGSCSVTQPLSHPAKKEDMSRLPKECRKRNMARLRSNFSNVLLCPINRNYHTQISIPLSPSTYLLRR